MLGVVLKEPTQHEGQLASDSQLCPPTVCRCPAYWRTVTLPKGLWCLAYSKCLINAEKQKCWADLCLTPVSPTPSLSPTPQGYSGVS